jgi:Ser/Thr protein kinase RdoA (MazF antagonist)
MPPADPAPVLRLFPASGPVERIEPLDMAGGWSGSLLWRIQGAGRRLCLRRWPAGHPAPDRLRLIHAVLTHAAREGIDYVPLPLSAHHGESFVEHAGHLWELTGWLPGVADYRQRPTRERLAAAFHALARFHLASSSFPKGSGDHEPPIGTAPAIVDRLEMVDHLVGGKMGRLATALNQHLSPDLDQRAAQIFARAAPRVPLQRAPLAAAAQLNLLLQPAIRDVHHDHVLFTGECVTGLIDFGALRIDTPLADVARLLGSLAGDDPASREHALAAYREVRPLSDGDRRLVELLDETNVVLSGLNWLGWLYVERRDMGPLPPIVRRLDEILVRLSAPARWPST